MGLFRAVQGWGGGKKVPHPPKMSSIYLPIDELLNKFSYSVFGRSMDFIPWDPSCCSFDTVGSFLPPWYPALKMTAPLIVGLISATVHS